MNNEDILEQFKDNLNLLKLGKAKKTNLKDNIKALNNNLDEKFNIISGAFDLSKTTIGITKDSIFSLGEISISLLMQENNLNKVNIQYNKLKNYTLNVSNRYNDFKQKRNERKLKKENNIKQILLNIKEIVIENKYKTEKLFDIKHKRFSIIDTLKNIKKKNLPNTIKKQSEKISKVIEKKMVINIAKNLTEEKINYFYKNILKDKVKDNEVEIKKDILKYCKENNIKLKEKHFNVKINNELIEKKRKLNNIKRKTKEGKLLIKKGIKKFKNKIINKKLNKQKNNTIQKGITNDRNI